MEAMEMNGKLMETMKKENLRKLKQTIEMNGKPKKTNGNNGDEWKTRKPKKKKILVEMSKKFL